jgi:hypothetical protein
MAGVLVRQSDYQALASALIRAAAFQQWQLQARGEPNSIPHSMPDLG